MVSEPWAFLELFAAEFGAGRPLRRVYARLLTPSILLHLLAPERFAPQNPRSLVVAPSLNCRCSTISGAGRHSSRRILCHVQTGKPFVRFSRPSICMLRTYRLVRLTTRASSTSFGAPPRRVSWQTGWRASCFLHISTLIPSSRRAKTRSRQCSRTGASRCRPDTGIRSWRAATLQGWIC